MRTYLWLCLLIVFLVVMYGFALPYLYSADDLILVGMGFSATLASIAVCMLIISEICKQPEIKGVYKFIINLWSKK